jgi:AcrR family transcriptional regulator
MPGADLDDRLDRLLRTVEDGVTAGDPAAVARRGRRRRLARRTAGAGAVAALLAAVVVVAALLPERVPRPAAVATGPAPGGVPDGAASWFDAHLSGNPGELVVSVTAPVAARSRPSDPCWEGYQPVARAEPDRMVVTIRRLRPRAPAPEGHSCTTVGLLLSLTVPLPEDLRGRPLVDGATGQRRPLVEGLLTPGWLPDNWFVQMMYPTGRGERWRRVYHQGGGVRAGRGPWRIVELPPGPAERVTVVAIPPRLLGSWNRWPDTPVVGHTQVRGRRAEIDADPRHRIVSVRWREGEVAYVVTGRVRQGATLRQVQELVVRIAQSLR